MEDGIWGSREKVRVVLIFSVALPKSSWQSSRSDLDSEDWIHRFSQTLISFRLLRGPLPKKRYT